MAIETKIIISALTAQAESAMRSLGTSVDGVSRKFFDLSGVAAGLTGALSITAFAGFIKSSIDAADNLNDLAQKTGTGVEALAGLKFAADQNGTSLEAVALASKKLSTAMADHPDILKKFGITAKDSTGALVQLADIFAAMPDGAEKTALAVKLLGRSGEEMIPFLNQGSAALRQMAEEGARLNPITAEMAKQADQFNDQLNKLSAQSKSAGISIANDLLPPLNEALESLLKFAKRGGGMEKVEIKWLDEMVSSAGINFLKLEVMFEKFAAKTTFGNLSKRHQAAADIAGVRLEKMKRDIATQVALADMSALPDISTAKQQSGKTGKSLYDALGGDGKTKKNDPFKLENEAWVREKEFQIAKLEEGRKKDEKAARDHARAVGEANRIIFDIDPQKKANAEWERLLELQAEVGKEMLSDTDIGKHYAKTYGEIDKAGTDSFKSLENAVRGWGNAFTDEMTKMVRTGKMDFASLADSIINDLIRIQIQKNVTKPLMEAGTGLLDGLFGGMFDGGGGGGGSGVTANASSIDLSYMGLPSFAVGTDYVPRDMIAQIHKGERIVPAAQNNGMASAQVSVSTSFSPVINAAPGTDTGAILSAVRQLMPSFIAENQRTVLGAVNQALVSRGQQPIRA